MGVEPGTGEGASYPSLPQAAHLLRGGTSDHPSSPPLSPPVEGLAEQQRCIRAPVLPSFALQPGMLQPSRGLGVAGGCWSCLRGFGVSELVLAGLNSVPIIIK